MSCLLSAVSIKLTIYQIKYTVIVATKRHHIRFFPREGDAHSADRNGNALPGTLVERDITHPFEDDFCEFIVPSYSPFVIVLTCK